MPKIIGLCGCSGSGKTTLVNQLGSTLDGTTLFWDDFDDISQAPDDYLAWYESGQDYSAWHYDDLAQVLQSLKQGHEIICPATKVNLKPTSYIIVDAPLGRKHHNTGQHLDLVVFIDTPLDISLARRLIRDYRSHDKSKKLLLEELELYLNHTRKLFLMDGVKKSADFVVNGALSLEDQTKAILDQLKS
jgi:uridine kinase